MQARFGDCTVKTETDHTITLISRNGSHLPVMEYLDSNGISVYEAKELLPSLEDVFVKVTGLEAAKLKKEKVKEGMVK